MPGEIAPGPAGRPERRPDGRGLRRAGGHPGGRVPGRGGGRWSRPADAVAGPDGTLHVSDYTAGAVNRLAPPG